MKENTTLNQILDNGLKSLGITIPDSKPLMDYLQLLQKWNKAYNLTAIRDPQEMLKKHILDSLAILTWVKGPRVIDVGSGAGLPGIPIAIARPEFHCVLLDSNGKKTRFLNEVKRQLRLTNLEVVQFRVENYRPEQGFDTVVSRAFSSIEQMLNWTQHLNADEGISLAMKGRHPEEELIAIKTAYHVKNYNVPGIEGERCCVIINNK